MNYKNKNYIIFASLLIVLILISSFSYYERGIVYSLVNNDIDYLIDYINGFGIFAEVALIIITILEVLIAPIPPLVLYITAGILFGPFKGGVLVLIGNVLGASIAFLIARKLGREHINKVIDKKVEERFNLFLKKYGFVSIFLLRVNPITSSDLISYLSGLTNISMRKFILGTSLGLAPLIFLQTYIGGDLIKGNPFLYFIFILVSIIYFLIIFYGLLKLSKKR